MEDALIGKGTWLDKVADTLVKREQRLGRKLDLINVESGLGASGIAGRSFRNLRLVRDPLWHRTDATPRHRYDASSI